MKFRIPNSEFRTDARTSRADYSAFGIRQSAFTLTELLIVISIIVLVLAMAMPAFKFITGTRSIEGAQNQVSAMLARVRSEAVGLQEVRGVFFYVDNATDRIVVADVRQADPPAGAANKPGDYIHDVLPAAAFDGRDEVDVYLDLVPDSDPVILPPGVGCQVFDSCAINTAVTPNVRTDDGYLGFNRVGRTGTGDNAIGAAPAPGIAPGGVILFDSSGRITNLRYALRTRTSTFVATEMGNLLYRNTGTDPATVADFLPWSVQTPPLFFERAAVGFVLYDRAAYLSQGYAETDWEITQVGTYAANEKPKEDWLDTNTTPLLVSRYNGTLIKGE